MRKLFNFYSGDIVLFEVVDGGLICSSGVHVEEMGDKTDECYIVNAAVYVGYWVPDGCLSIAIWHIVVQMTEFLIRCFNW